MDNLGSKQVIEEYFIEFDFTKYLTVGDPIASAVVSVIRQDTGLDVTATLTDVTLQTITNPVVYVWIKGGIDTKIYTFTCDVTTVAGRVFTLDGELEIDDNPATGDGVALSVLLASVKAVLQDSAYTDETLTAKINEAVNQIAAGVRMPDGSISPALPNLYKTRTITTALARAYVSMPSDYQRNMINVADSSGNRILPPAGGDYYAFQKFMKQISDMRMAETGSIYRVCVKGNRFYYQGIPTVAETLWIQYYRKPTEMVATTDLADGPPSHLQEILIKSYVLKELFAEGIEYGEGERSSGARYWTSKFYETMVSLIDYVGIVDGEPLYYGEDSFEDRGICD